MEVGAAPFPHRGLRAKRRRVPISRRYPSFDERFQFKNGSRRVAADEHRIRVLLVRYHWLRLEGSVSSERTSPV